MFAINQRIPPSRTPGTATPSELGRVESDRMPASGVARRGRARFPV